MAYASVLSAKRQMERLRFSSNPETKSIYEHLCSIETLFHEKYAQMKGNKLRFDPLEEQVEAAANNIEDLIEKAYALCVSHCSKGPGDETTTNSSYSQKFFQLTQEISSLTEKVKQSKEIYQKAVDSTTSFIKLKIMSVVGLDSEVFSLLDWVRSYRSNLNTMAVVGDTRTCESTLRQIYTHASIRGLFQHCLWVTLGRHCNLQALTLVLNHEGFYIDRRCEGMGNISLVDHLYGFLSKQRYLIVLHDIQSSEMWDLFRPLLPNGRTGSRIILTTSMSNVAHQIGNEFNKNWQLATGTIDVLSFSSRFSEVKLVGLEDEVLQLVSKVMDQESELVVVGMVGIGKTTLVKQVYDHPDVRNHFDIRLWLTIGPSYYGKNLIRIISQDIGYHPKQSDLLEMDDLGESIYKFLCGRRYLLVLDDIWSIQSFEELKQYLPNDTYESRIILTTRLLDIAQGFRDCVVHQKSFLSDEDSWDLLNGMVFTNPGEYCSYELQKYGKKIAKNCEGLPLAILAVGKQLRKQEKTAEYWKEVSEQENLHDIIKDDYESISETISLSYKMLPRRLKECFLYIGIIPNFEILVSTLIKLWCAEEFFGPQENKSLEDVAEEYLKEAVSQSVVLVREQGTREGRIKICRVHFVFRYLCVTEAENEKFCLIIRKYVDCSRKGTSKQRRICIHNSVVLGIKGAQDNMELISGVCSVLCLGPLQQYLQQVHFKFRMLKILNALNILFYEFPHQVLELVRLKYFAMTYSGEIPGSISQLSNLEVLVVGRFHSIISSSARACMPVEIWNLNWLKHLQCMGVDLLDPCNEMIQEHLISLSGVSAGSCSKGVLSRVPNLKKLGIHIELAPDEVQSFSFLNDVAQQLLNLESLKCVVHGLSSQVVRSPNLGFPDSLIKLTLSGCRFPWSQMATIGGLQRLEVLKLRCYAFCGPQWKMADEKEFPSLRVLLLEDLDIKEWLMDGDELWWLLCGLSSTKIFMCCLERLMIRHCYKLREIPPGMLPRLRVVEINDCPMKLQRQMEEKYKYFGRDFVIRANYSWDDKKQKSAGRSGS